LLQTISPLQTANFLFKLRCADPSQVEGMFSFLGAA
jgi:hypothetical protein